MHSKGELWSSPWLGYGASAALLLGVSLLLEHGAVDSHGGVDSRGGVDSHGGRAASPPSPSTCAAPAPATSAEPLVLRRRDRERLLAELTHRLGRAPTEDELAARVESFREEEVLVRQALALGLTDTDSVLRGRLAARLLRALAETSAVAEPDEAALRARFEQEQAGVGERVSVEVVFLSRQRSTLAEDEARLLARLRAGGTALGVGDAPPAGRRLHDRSLEELRAPLGDSCAEAAFAAVAGEWLACSADGGRYLLRVVHRAKADPATFEQARQRLRDAAVEAARLEAGRAAARALVEATPWRDE